MLKKLQLRKSKISNTSKTRPNKKNLTTVLKSASQNYPQNAVKPESPRNSFKIVELYSEDLFYIRLTSVIQFLEVAINFGDKLFK